MSAALCGMILIFTSFLFSSELRSSIYNTGPLYSLRLFLRFLLKKLLGFSSILTNYFDNSQEVISKALKISIIFSLLIVYVVATYNPKIICNDTKDIYNLLVTVILIPIVYDSIKSKS